MSVVIRHRVGSVLASCGILTLVVELCRYWFAGHTIHAAPVAIGCILGFVGFYMLDSKGAEDAGGFLVNSAVKLIGVVRTGRRSTDRAAVVTAPDDANGVPSPTGEKGT